VFDPGQLSESPWRSLGQEHSARPPRQEANFRLRSAAKCCHQNQIKKAHHKNQENIEGKKHPWVQRGYIDQLFSFARMKGFTERRDTVYNIREKPNKYENNLPVDKRTGQFDLLFQTKRI